MTRLKPYPHRKRRQFVAEIGESPVWTGLYSLMTSTTTPTCNIDAAVTRAVFNVRHVQVVAGGYGYCLHGNITDVNKIIVKSSLNVQRRQTG